MRERTELGIAKSASDKTAREKRKRLDDTKSPKKSASEMVQLLGPGWASLTDLSTLDLQTENRLILIAQDGNGAALSLLLVASSLYLDYLQRVKPLLSGVQLSDLMSDEKIEHIIL